MEGPERMGAGPETTGINNEQLNLFAEHETVLNNHEELISEPAARDITDATNPRRLHALGHRPDRLHTSQHAGVRGDRLEGVCRRHKDSND